MLGFIEGNARNSKNTISMNLFHFAIVRGHRIVYINIHVPIILMGCIPVYKLINNNK